MMAFIIDSLLNSNFGEQITVSGKKQVYLLFLIRHVTVTRNCCKGTVLAPPPSAGGDNFQSQGDLKSSCYRYLSGGLTMLLV